jgi:hypothetical protein
MLLRKCEGLTLEEVLEVGPLEAGVEVCLWDNFTKNDMRSAFTWNEFAPD